MTIQQALTDFSLAIAKREFGAKRYIADKEVIAAGFGRAVYTPECGAIIDYVSGAVWVVTKSGGEFLHWRVN